MKPAFDRTPDQKPGDTEVVRDEKVKGKARNKLIRNKTFPSVKKIRWSKSVEDFATHFADLKNSAKNLVTLNIEPNTCKLCPHKYSCAQNAVYKGLFRSFAAGYMFKSLLAFMSALLSGKLGRKGRTVKEIFLGQDALRFGQFIGVMSFLYKAVLCTLRRMTQKNDPKYHAIAGFVAGLGILLDDPKRRRNTALYCIVRALADLYNNLREQRYIRPIPNGDVLLFTATQVPIVYALIKAPDLLAKSYLLWICRMGNITSESIGETCRSRISDSMHRLPGEPWQSCAYHSHDPSCVNYTLVDWFTGILRAGRIYLPVHFLPTFLFKPMKIIKNPTKYLQSNVWKVMRSALFLTTYQSSTKAIHCMVRNIIKDDPSATSVLAGIVAGLSILVEHPKRRTELTLYTLPRALEVCYNYIAKFHSTSRGSLSKSEPMISLVAFQCAIALWMYIQAIPAWKQLNSLNKSGLRAVFGSRH
mmetsp:Transcript_21428/g.31858  ORF Transcript_21428/g.31858 Transcript_21428/m.31858 type:complete len:473 (-) Transcript_21428:84-1502(-)